MSNFYKTVLLALLACAGAGLHAQTVVRGKVVDAFTKEPVAGATIQGTRAGCQCGCSSNNSGDFEMKCSGCDSISVSFIGYRTQKLALADKRVSIDLDPVSAQLQEIVLSANRGEGARRSEAPVAISTLTAKTLQDAKASMADQVLNKVSGVNMVNLGNEQHSMSIRQPMTTKSLFLYLEDGIPIRTTGLYNHNALLEMNMTATKSIEVIKGPSSSLYGSEAIGGVVNFITAAPPAVPVLKLSAQANNVGYKRADWIAGITSGKWGFMVSGYFADEKDEFREYSDFHKGTITARVDYRFSPKTRLSSSVTYLDYYSDMSGSIDSAMFASHSFRNLQTFTYRAVEALRVHSTLTHSWSDNSKSTLTALYRDNTIGQNPAYRIKDDYRRVNGVFVGRKDLAHGEINENGFNSYSVIAQHRQRFHVMKAVLIGGFNMDLSPAGYRADYIRITKDTLSRKYVSYQPVDSALTHYSTTLNNYAAFVNVEFSPLEKLRIVASLRYDFFHYGFDNHLVPTAFSGSPDTTNHFGRVSPKIGFTYNFSGRAGMYANYSEGFVPPQVSELYTGVKVPNLDPSVFYNYEVGAWIQLLKNRLSADISAYHLKGTNEIISVKQDDGSYANQNTGETLHRGIEFGLNATPAKGLELRLAGAWSRHEFVNYTEKGVAYDGYEMNNAPQWMYNAEVWYRPSFLKGLRLGAELRHVGNYYADPLNTASYEGYNVLNLRAGYRLKAFEIWLNLLNATDHYYSYLTSKSAYGYSYQVADPRNLTLGVSYDFANLFKKQQ